MGSLGSLRLAGEVVAKDFAGWSDAVREEFDRNAFNGHVGGLLLRETDRVRVWDIRLAPGERLPAHRHVLDYFWTALTDGHSRQHIDDGTTREVSYRRGETRAYDFGAGSYLLHDLENIGDGPLAFITVELLESANRPLSLA
ncbi:hypothetical protein [Actinomadura sp. WMMA1423]|uniref:hypothetical protein n=1 Tax=Actinomadura sp. WMMA1423 TaxID=2591108 RepID=UPI0011478227|nr:hypothetical protein [Actinomadura sp. WMMA1423]